MKSFKWIAALSLTVGLPLTAYSSSLPGLTDQPPIILEGQDTSSKKACSLIVTAIGYDGAEVPENLFAQVKTSYAHDEASAPAIKIKVVPQKQGVLAGTAANGKDQIVIFLSSANIDIRNAKSFNLKWLHGSHFHTNRCDNMILVQQP